jgi:hypothetical protein
MFVLLLTNSKDFCWNACHCGAFNPDFSRVLQTASVFVSSLLSSIVCSFLNESLSLGRVQSILSFCRIAQPASFVHRMQAAAIMRRAARIVMIRMSSFLSIWRIRCFRGLGGTPGLLSAQIRARDHADWRSCKLRSRRALAAARISLRSSAIILQVTSSCSALRCVHCCAVAWRRW